MSGLSECRDCGATIRVELLPGWGEEPVKHTCLTRACHQCESVGECQSRTPCREASDD